MNYGESHCKNHVNDLSATLAYITNLFMPQNAMEELDVGKLIHEANSHLAVISGYVQLMQQRAIDAQAQETQWLNKIADECGKFKEFIASLSKYRKQD
jgi:hypothetical protein